MSIVSKRWRGRSHRSAVAAFFVVTLAAAMGIGGAAIADTGEIQGDVSGTIGLTVNDVFVNSNCTNVYDGKRGTKVPFTLKVNADVATDENGARNWYWYEINVIDNDSGETVSDFVRDISDFEQPADTSWSGALCSTLPAGSYRAVAYVCFDDTCDEGGNPHAVAVAQDSYRIMRVATRSYISRSGRTLTGTLKTASGTPIAGKPLRFMHGATVLATRTTNSTGHATFTGNYATSYHTSFAGTPTLSPSSSGTITVPRAGSGLSVTRSRSGAHAWKITAHLSGAGKAGKRIHLQRLYSTWRNTTKSCVTNSSGVCSVTFTQNSAANNGVWYRGSFAGSTYKMPAVSGRFHITKR